MVQFYPDNQSRYLYRKVEEPDDEVIVNPPLNIADSAPDIVEEIAPNTLGK